MYKRGVGSDHQEKQGPENKVKEEKEARSGQQ